jgi:hypothetical protein
MHKKTMKSMQDEPAKTYPALSGCCQDTNQVTAEDYKHLERIALTREIRVTVQKGTQAGIAAGLTVAAGVIMAGHVGAMVGGAIGTAVATKMSQTVVPLKDILKTIPVEKRRDIVAVVYESFVDEFIESIYENPELRLMTSGMSILGIISYMLDRGLLKYCQLERLDGILRNIFK